MKDKQAEFLKTLSGKTQYEITRILEDDLEADFDYNYAIDYAVENGNYYIVQYLLNKQSINSSVDHLKLLWLAKKNDDAPMARLLISRYIGMKGIDVISGKEKQVHPFYLAIEQGWLDLLQFYKDQDPDFKNTGLWPESANELPPARVQDWCRVVEKELWKEGMKDIFQRGLVWAIYCQQAPLVKLLIDDERITPLMENSSISLSPLILALETGNNEILELLLQDGRIMLAGRENEAFNKACALGNLDAVKLLLNYGVLPWHWGLNNLGQYQKTYSGWHLAARNKHDHVIDYLYEWKQPEERNKPEDREMFIEAIRGNHLGMVESLLPRVDPAFSNSLGLRMASSHGYDKIVACLLEEGRSRPQDLNNLAIRLAAENRHGRVVKLLLSDPRVNPDVRENLALRWAGEKEDTQTVRLLLDDCRVKNRHRFYNRLHSAKASDNGTNTVFLENVHLLLSSEEQLKKVNNQLLAKEILMMFIMSLSWDTFVCNLKAFKPKAEYLPEDKRSKLMLSKVINTCGLFRYAEEPAMPLDLIYKIADRMFQTAKVDSWENSKSFASWA